MSEGTLQFDVLILGGGPAGISTAIWCADLGLKAALIEGNDELGGQLLRIYNPIENYPGLFAPNGLAMRNAFCQHIENGCVKVLTGNPVECVDLISRSVVLGGELLFNAKTIVIATGVSRRRLGIPGEVEFEKRGVLTSGVGEKDTVTGKSVLIIGGGDAALENACILAGVANKVSVLHRGDSFSARRELIAAAAELPKVEFVFRTKLETINGVDRVTSATIRNIVIGDLSDVPVDAVLVRICVEPNSQIFRGQIDLDDLGYVVVDHRCATSIAGIYAVGDVANSVSPSISSAVGMGSTAAKSIVNWIREQEQQAKSGTN